MSNAISHDFNNYLQIILGSIEVVEKKHVFSDEIKDYFEKIRLATIDATTRVKLLQRFSGTSSVKSEYSPININDVVKDAILQTQPLWKNTSESKGISINIKVNEGLVKNLSGNKSELRTVVFNLIKNSIEAMPKGGTITFNTGMIDNFVYLQVSDDGIGIDLSNQEKIFQPLFTTKGFELGKGFGLTSSYSIIKEHNGSLKILESIAGKGTTIEILLPVTEEKIPEETEKTMSGSDKKIKILWVDDDSMIRHIVSDMCDILGYAVTVAENAYEALDLLNNESFHFIFTDIGMPGMNGWQLLDKIDELHKGKFVVGVVSGWGDQIKDEEKEAHVFNFIFTKPIKMKDLKKNIDYLISTNKINIE